MLFVLFGIGTDAASYVPTEPNRSRGGFQRERDRRQGCHLSEPRVSRKPNFLMLYLASSTLYSETSVLLSLSCNWSNNVFTFFAGLHLSTLICSVLQQQGKEAHRAMRQAEFTTPRRHILDSGRERGRERPSLSPYRHTRKFGIINDLGATRPHQG